MVNTPQKGRRYLRAAGVSAWVLSGTPALWMILHGNVADQSVALPRSDFPLWAGAWLVFILSFWLSSGGVGDERHHYRNRVLLLVETAAALFMFRLVCTGLETTLLAVVAAQLGVYFRLPAGLLWLVAQTVALFWRGLNLRVDMPVGPGSASLFPSKVWRFSLPTLRRVNFRPGAICRG